MCYKLKRSIEIGLVGLVFIVSATVHYMYGSSDTQKWPRYAQHELEGHERYEAAQEWLDDYSGIKKNDGGYSLNVNKDDEGLKKFAAILGAQQKLEDFLIKSREAEHASLQVWSSVLAGFVGTLIGALLTLIGTIVTRDSGSPSRPGSVSCDDKVTPDPYVL